MSKEILQSGTGHTLFQWGWRERNFSTAWMQVVPKTPRSKARSQSFSQPLSWRQSFILVSEIDERWHQTEVERSRAVICAFFIDERDTLLKEVSMDVVKFETSVDSRNLH